MLENKIVGGDKKHIEERGMVPTGWLPSPRGEGGKINPHATQFSLGDGKLVTVFHVKPVYYETKDETWRPLEEVCEHHGNKRIILTDLAIERMHPRFMSWLQKRQSVFGNGELAVNSSVVAKIVSITKDYQNNLVIA